MVREQEQCGSDFKRMSVPPLDEVVESVDEIYA